MEAVAAVGVAAAAVQFLDYSVKTLALCREIRDSPSGSTKANEELTKSINKLTAMQKDLRKTSSTTSSTYRQLIRAVQDCSAVATELLQLLEHIREQAKKSGGVVRAAWQAMAKRKTIERLPTSLPLPGAASLLVNHPLLLKIEFVHRSAHDYIASGTNAARLAWVKSVDEREILHKTVSGALWLAQNCPMYTQMASGRLLTFGLRYIFGVSEPWIVFAKIDQTSFFKGLEKLINSLHS
jgi:hypothetical protein